MISLAEISTALPLSTNDRILKEIHHNRKILGREESLWGWATPAGKLRLERRAQEVARLGAWTPDDQLLELGCGTGLFSGKVYEKTGARITAIDIFEDFLHVARSRWPHVTFLNENAMQTNFEDNCFDGVYGGSVLHHLVVDLGLKEAFRVLKPGGRMVLAEPNMLNPQIAVQKNVPFFKDCLGDSPDETALVRWSLARKMRDAGFEQIRIVPFDFLHPKTPPAWIAAVQWLGRRLERIPVLTELAGSLMIFGRKSLPL